MKSKELIPSLGQLEAFIPAGQLTAVKNAFRGMNLKQIPREELSRYANLANRVGLGRTAYRILHSVIRDDSALDIEKLEYAEALRRMGLLEEAKKILAALDANKLPLVFLRMAFCLINQWRYFEAVPFLKKHILTLDRGDYSHMVARVNLAAALAFEQNETEAMPLLEQIKSEARDSNRQLLYVNCLELEGQLLTRAGHYDAADKILLEAAASSDGQSRYLRFINKWQAISKSLRSDCVHEELLTCRLKAHENQDWETLRDCDLYIGFLGRDQDLLSQVYFGTPFSSYRNRIRAVAGSGFSPRENYVWNQTPGTPTARILDVLNGRFDNAVEAMETGHLAHRMLLLLSTDFYRPVSVGAAFSYLFQDEDFAQMGSANRVSQAVRRLRQWLDASSLIEIEQNDGNYRLLAKPGVGLRVGPSLEDFSSNAISWKQVLSRFPNGIVSRDNVAETLGCSVTSAKRLLRWAQSSGQATAIGAGPGRRYVPTRSAA